MHTTRFNGKEYSVYSVTSTEDTLVLEMALVPSMDELQRDVIQHGSADVVIYSSGAVVQTYVDFGTFVSIAKDIETTHVIVTLSKTFNDTAALEILVGEHITATKALEYRASIEALADFADDSTASKNVWAYKAWESGVAYSVGDKRTDEGSLYKCLQAHTSQDTWRPADSPSLWARVINEDPSGDYPVWEQPDSTNPYMKDDIVWYPTANSTLYQSLVDNNVWAPNVYGWTTEVEE